MSRPHDRAARHPLLAPLIAALIVLCAPLEPSSASEPFPDLTDPPTTNSQNGILSVTLTATARDLPFGDVVVPGLIYNGAYAGPVLRVRPGDRMLIRLVNRLAEPTNIHFHGIETSPLGNSDNVHTVVDPGESFLYSIVVPDTQSPGLYWYHAHLHGAAERQAMSGLSGALMVEGFAQQFPGLDGIAERLFVLKEYEFPDSEDPAIDGELHERLQTVNGETGVTVHMRPHETQLWHLGNQSANRIIHLALRGHRFGIVGEDGTARNNAMQADVLNIEPSARMEVLVEAGEPGVYDLVSEGILTGTARSRVMGHLVVEGEPASPVAALDRFPSKEDLRTRDVTTRRTIGFTQDNDTEQYFIDGKMYDHDRMDIRVPLGSLEEWTLRNDSDDFHEFHIHQVHFQVVAIDGKAVPFDGYRDTVRIPERGSATIRIPFARREIVGKFVFHCHVLKHEDKGMMANIEVYDPAKETFLSPIKALLTRLGSARGGLPYAFCGL